MEIRQINIEYGSKGGIISDVTDRYIQTKVLPWMSVLEVRRGKCSVSIENGEKLELESGQFLIVGSNRLHNIECTADNEGIELRWAYISARVNKGDCFDGLYELPRAVYGESRLGVIFDTLFESDNVFEDYSCYYDILRVIFSLSKMKPEREESSVFRAIEYIENNYTSKITVSDLAEIANLSSSRFYAVFGERYGISPVNYINSFRLAMASDLLLSDDVSISDVSCRVGIFDPIYFNKMFRKIYGVAPSNFRKVYRKI